MICELLVSTIDRLGGDSLKNVHYKTPLEFRGQKGDSLARIKIRTNSILFPRRDDWAESIFIGQYQRYFCDVKNILKISRTSRIFPCSRVVRLSDGPNTYIRRYDEIHITQSDLQLVLCTWKFTCSWWSFLFSWILRKW